MRSTTVFVCAVVPFLVLLIFALDNARADEAEELVALEQRVNALKAAGKYREAIPLAEQLLARAERLYVDHPEIVAGVTNDLAILYMNQGRYADAEPLYKRSLATREKMLGAVHADVADSLLNLGALYWEQGRLSEIEPLFKRALATYERTLNADDRRLGLIFNSLATLYMEQGRFADAEPLYKRSLAIHELIQGANHSDVALALNNMANMYFRQEQYAEAEPLYKRALAIREKVLGPEHPDVAFNLASLANLYVFQSRYTEAEPLYKRALAIREKLLGANHPNVATSLDGLADVYLQQDRCEEAGPLYERSLAIRTRALGEENLYVAYTLDRLACVYMVKKKNAEAEANLKRALAIRQKAYGDKSAVVAVALKHLANFSEDQGRFVEAEEFARRAAEIYKVTSAGPTERYYSQSSLARLAWKQGRKDEAVAELVKALDMAEAARSLSSGGEQERATHFERFAKSYERMIAWQRELGHPAEALAAAERSRARSLVDQMNAAHIDLLAGLPEAEAKTLRAAESAAQARVAELEKQLELLPKRRDVSAEERQRVSQELAQQIGPARQAAVDAFAAIRNASPAYRQLVGQNFKPATLDEVQTRIAGDDTLVLEYFLGADAGYVFVIPPRGQAVRVEALSVNKEQAEKLGIDAGPLTADRLGRAFSNDQGSGVLQELRKPEQKPSATLPPLAARLAELWQVLIPAPERTLLVGDKLKKLVIIPDGSLAMFPFDTLVVEPGDDPKYLLDVGPKIIYSPSATLLINLDAKTAGAAKAPGVNKALSVGNANYGGQSSSDQARAGMTARSRYGALRGSLTPLPFTAWECQWVSEVLKKSGIEAGVLQGDAAREASVRTYGSGRNILHFACHGLVDQSYGNLFGALALTPGPQGAADPSDDGFLTLAEIYALPLTGTELSILSACDTNLGPQQKGEGTWSLSRGFLVAGSRRVVASNWLVDDEAAASLVSVYCNSIAKDTKAGNVDYAAGLQAAKRWVRAQEKWKSPYYWGTFVLVGPN